MLCRYNKGMKIDKRQLYTMWTTIKGNRLTKNRRLIDYIMEVYNIDCDALPDVAVKIQQTVTIT